MFLAWLVTLSGRDKIHSNPERYWENGMERFCQATSAEKAAEAAVSSAKTAFVGSGLAGEFARPHIRKWNASQHPRKLEYSKAQ